MIKDYLPITSTYLRLRDAHILYRTDSDLEGISIVAMYAGGVAKDIFLFGGILALIVKNYDAAYTQFAGSMIGGSFFFYEAGRVKKVQSGEDFVR